MIRVTAIANADAAKNYFRSADYYVQGQEEPSHWHGKGAERLGLTGPVTYADFERLCDNQHPESGHQLTARHVANRRVGYDWTFSPSKSVSLAYMAGDTRIADEFRGAVADTMAEAEREMQTRVRKGGAFENRTTGNLVWVDFLHKTSRPIKGVPDPQLHVHAVVLNATWDPVEGQWKAGEFAALKANAPYFQAVFRARLANRLQALGYEIRRTKDDFEIAGVSADVVKRFSRRTTLIEKKADTLQANLDEIAPGLKLSAEAKAKLGATTREAKSDAFTWEQLVKVWTSQLSPAERDALLPGEPALTKDTSRESVDWALAHLLERASVVPERQVMTEALKHGLGCVTPEGILEALYRRKDLVRRVVDGVELVTTQGVLNEEKEIVSFAERGKGRWTPLGGLSNEHSPCSPSRSRPADLATLSPSQQAAIRHAWTSRDSLILIRGAAGSGKTTLTRTLLAGVDVPYAVLAPSAEASRGVLRREQVDPNADTLAKFLIDDEMQGRVRGGLIVLDEASLTGAHDLNRLLKAADQLKARVLLLGDRRQHKSVARGDVLALLEDKAKLKVASVGEIRRQAGQYKEAVKLASDGFAAEAFEKLDKLGWVKEGHDALVEDYIAGLKAGKSQLVIAPTHAEGDTVTAKLRERLKQEGIIDGEETAVESLTNCQLTQAQKEDAATLSSLAGATACFVRHGKAARSGDRVTITGENAAELAKEGSRFVVYRPKQIGLAVGDTVRVTANGWDVTGNHRLNNGAVYRIAGFTDGGIQFDNGWVVSKGFGHLQHGLVSTSHAAQGRTVDQVLIAQGSQSLPASDKAQFYVSVSRGRQKATVYVDDRATTLEAIERERPRMLASELVREPRRKLREKKKRALQFMRGLVHEIRDEQKPMKDRSVQREWP